MGPFLSVIMRHSEFVLVVGLVNFIKNVSKKRIAVIEL